MFAAGFNATLDDLLLHVVPTALHGQYGRHWILDHIDKDAGYSALAPPQGISCCKDGESGYSSPYRQQKVPWLVIMGLAELGCLACTVF
jgi:hypothetical protein